MRSRVLIVLVFSMIIGFWVDGSLAVHELFKEMDANRDGKVDRGEFTEDMARDVFQKLDTDKDGFISPEEWRKMDYIEEAEKTQEVFKYADHDADKLISFPEFSDYVKKYSNVEEAFMVMDKDRDNSLSVDEVTMRPLFRLMIIRY